MQRNQVLGLVAAGIAAVVIALVVILAVDDEPAGETPEEAASVSTSSTTTSTASPATSTTAPGATSTTSAGTASNRVLRFDSYDRYRIGMTKRESGLTVDPDSSGDPEACGFAEAGNGVVVMIAADRVVRFDVIEGSTVKTEAGIGIGATEAEVKRTYGDRVTTEPHEYQELGHYLVVRDPARSNLLLLFETDGTRVTTFRSGERNAVEAPEGCA
jgi:hypothetical protein